MSDSLFPSMRGHPRSSLGRAVVFLAAVAIVSLLALSHSAAFLIGTHEVTAQFATQDGKPLANAEVRAFAPGDRKNPVLTGRTDSEGKFVFDADREGFWSAEAYAADQVARVMIRVGGDSQSPIRISPFLVISIVAVLVGIAVWYHLLRARTRRPRS